MIETDNQFLVRILSDVLRSDVLDEADASRARDTIDMISDPRCFISVASEEGPDDSRKISIDKAIEKSRRLGLNWYIFEDMLVAHSGPYAGTQRLASTFEMEAWARFE